MKRAIILGVLAAIILNGCSASNLVKRAERRDPSIFEETVRVETDTLVVEVEVVKEKIVLDTLVEIVQLDPITKKEIVIKYRIQKDSIMIDCPDNEVVTVIEYRDKIISLKPTLKEKIAGGIYLGIGIIVFAVFIIVLFKVTH